MQIKILILAVLLAVLITDVLCEKPRKLKKYKHKSKISNEKKEASIPEQDASILAVNSEEGEKKVVEDEKSEETVDAPDVPTLPQDPCLTTHCGAGKICKLTENGHAECVCVPYCAPESDPRRKVCSNLNETWGSDCEIYQMRCWCEHGMEQCRGGEPHKHLHIDYYGACKDMPECSESEKADFPRRMRDWLFNIMRDMADRSELSPHYLEMEREAENNQTRRWTNAAIWKWCDLDGHPRDRTVSRHELFPIRAPLMTLEHCIAPFLNTCDADDDHRITLKEWGKCLELSEEELEDKCDELREEEEAKNE